MKLADEFNKRKSPRYEQKNTVGNKMFIFMQSKKIREIEQFELNITTCEQQRAAAIRKYINTHTHDERLQQIRGGM